MLKYECPSDVYEDGLNYVFALMLDYEKVVTEIDTLTVMKFLNDWNIITKDDFANLKIGDTVYDCDGRKYIVSEEPTMNEQDDEYVVAVKLPEDSGDLESFFVSGDLYHAPFCHDWVLTKPRKKKGDNTICPILITSQAQPQN